jgi:hypothetical protein
MAANARNPKVGLEFFGKQFRCLKGLGRGREERREILVRF